MASPGTVSFWVRYTAEPDMTRSSPSRVLVLRSEPPHANVDATRARPGTRRMERRRVWNTMDPSGWDASQRTVMRECWPHVVVSQAGECLTKQILDDLQVDHMFLCLRQLS